MYENIRFGKANMTVDDNSFYMMDDTRDVLFRKTDGGKTAFTYPLGTILSYPVTSLEFDGINFWSMENVSTSAVAIKRWKIDNNGICALMNTFNFTSVAAPRTFTVEHYHDTLSSGVAAGENIIHIDNYASTLVSGSILTLGPTTSGSYYEEVTITSISGQDITLSSGVSYNYALGDDVNFYNNIWMFNSTGAGTLHKINALTGSGIVTYSGSIYDDISACTFYKVEGPLDSPKDYLVYYKNNQINYLDVSTMIVDTSMEIDNGAYAIYDLAMVETNLYRLQQRQIYYGVDTGLWATYNYVLSTTRRFIDTISVSAYPVILPNNATNVSKITALVNDQYGDGVWDKPVYFTDDDTVGFMTINPAYTDYFFGTGEAVSYYKAGTAVRTVTVEGTATQFD
jgi:hypothetical protein